VKRDESQRLRGEPPISQKSSEKRVWEAGEGMPRTPVGVVLFPHINYPEHRLTLAFVYLKVVNMVQLSFQRMTLAF